MKKTLEMWAVVWTEEARIPYGITQDKYVVISLEPLEEIKYRIGTTKGRPAYRYADASAIFPSKEEAEAFRRGNTDWMSVPCTITYTTTKVTKK